MVPQVGQRIGPYEILGRLGSGGMGLVFSAWDARLQRDVAIKLLREEYATPEMRSRFLQEARAASGLNHPNICTIFDMGEQEGDPYLVMELLKGETLRTRINQGAITPREILRVAHDIADALTVAHSRGVIHRDIKPANIILVNKPGGSFGTKVLDFGLAKIDTGYGVDSVLDLTNTGTTVGTVSYMSPEQARGEALDFRSDLFSLGVMLYEMATGRLPFQGATSALVFVQLLSHPPDPIRPQNPEISEDLEQLILRLLDKDRNRRFQNAAELMEAVDLIPFAGSTPSRAATTTKPVPAPSLPLAPPERRAISNPVPVERRNSSRVFPRTPGEPPTLPVRRASSPGKSSPTTPVAKPAPPAAPMEDSKAVRPAMSGDEFLRPVRRVATPNTDSSAYNLRVARESSGVLPVVPPTPATPPPDSATRITPVPTAPPLGSTASNVPAARPITSQSIRPVSSQIDVPVMNLPRITSVRPSPRFFAKVDDTPEFSKQESSKVVEAAKPEKAKSDSVRIAVTTSRAIAASAYKPVQTSEPKPRMWLLVVGLFVMAAIGAVAWSFWPRTAAPSSTRTVPLVINKISNMSGIDTLPGAVAAGLEIDLAQSPQVLVQNEATLLAGARASGDTDVDVESLEGARKAGKMVGAAEILFGEVRISANTYVVAVRVNSVSTGGEVLRAEESAASIVQLSDAIDRLAIDVRLGLGESSDSISKSSVPLAKEASSNLDALQAYGAGSIFLGADSLSDAQINYERAIALDPHFPQPYLRLADIYRQQRSMVSAASSATSAQSSAASAGERTQLLAQASFNLNASGDLSADASVVQKLLADYSSSVSARLAAASAQRGQGKFAESLDIVQGALHREPLHPVVLGAAETDYIALERPDAAAPLEAQAARAGHPHADLKLLLTYLLNGGQGPVDISVDATGHTPLGVMQALLLEATGSESSAMHIWQTLAAHAASTPHLESAAGDLYSQAARNRALLSDCGTTNQLLSRLSAYPAGPDTIFRSGLASALCGNLDAARDSVENLRQNYPASFAAKGYYIPEISAIIHWKSGDAQGGLDDLGSSTQYDLLSITPYLRGLMHMKVGQTEVAIQNFQFVLSHRGAMALVDPLVIPLSQIGLARAYAVKGDHSNSAAAYAKFLTMWKNADTSSPMVDEARHGH